jgi:hypothetical protein
MDNFGRSGSFSQGGILGPFGGGGADFGKYNGGADLASQTARLDRQQADTAWGNGLISDAQYLKALDVFAKSTTPGTSEYISAHDDLHDATYSINRSPLQRRVDRSDGAAKIAAYHSLIRYDKRYLSTMKGGDKNQNRQELADRIAGNEASIRTEIWNSQVAKYNANRLSPEAMLATARRLRSQATTPGEARGWSGQIDAFKNVIDDGHMQKLQQDWQHDDGNNGKAILDFIDKRMAGMSKDSPAYQDLARQKQDWGTNIHNREVGQKDAEMSDRHANGLITDDKYLEYMASRVKDAPKGSEEQRQAKRALIAQTYTFSHDKLSNEYKVSGDPTALIDFLNSSMVIMQPGSQEFLARQNEILQLQVGQIHDNVSLAGNSGMVAVGHYLTLGGTPTNSAGFASQFDGSPFASQNCMYTAGAMLAWGAGKTGLSGGDMRFYSGDNDTNLGGTMTQLEGGFAHIGLGLERHDGMKIEDFRRHVANGQGAVVAGSYGRVTGEFNLSNNGFSGPHAVYVDRAKKGADGQWYYYVMDPLARNPSENKWWPETVMRNFAWSNAPNDTNGWYGDVAFATRSPGSSKLITRPHAGAPPPAQSFDTDAHGKSTVGHGGGTSRKEAGYTPPGFGRTVGAKETAVDPGELLGALSAGGLLNETAMGDIVNHPEALRAAATDAMRRSAGDPVTAAMLMITGVQASSDPTQWTDKQKWLSTIIAPQFENAHETLARTGARSATGSMGGALAVVVSERPTPEVKYRNDGDAIAGDLLAKIGAPNTVQMRDSVLVWMGLVNGGNTMDANNPFRLLGKPGMSGGVSVNPETGLIAYASADDGTTATANELVKHFPNVVAAARAGRPEGFMVTLGNSGWDPNLKPAVLIAAHNAQPGARTILTGGQYTPAFHDSIGQVARWLPDLGALARVDPTDPIQNSWFEGNRNLALDAWAHGRSEFQFMTPDGRSITMPVTAGIATDITNIAIDYASSRYDYTVATLGPGSKEAKDLHADIQALNNSRFDTSSEALGKQIDHLTKVGSDALSANDPTQSFTSWMQQGAMLGAFLQNTRDAQGNITPDVNKSPVLAIYRQNGTDISKIVQMVEDYNNSPYTELIHADSSGEFGLTLVQDPTQYNALGVGVTPGQRVEFNQFRVFQTQVLKDGRPLNALVTSNMVSGQPSDPFARVKVVLPDPNGNPSGIEVERPSYTLGTSGFVPIRLKTGAVVYQKAIASDDQAAIYVVGPQATSNATPAQIQRIKDGTDPQVVKTQWTAGAGSVYKTNTYDTAPDGKPLTMTWWSTDGKTWVGLNEHVNPDLVINDGVDEVKVDKDGNLTVKGQPVGVASVAHIRGTQDNDPRGPTINHTVVRTVGPDGVIDGTLSDFDRRALGGSWWDKSEEAPFRARVGAAIGGIAQIAMNRTDALLAGRRTAVEAAADEAARRAAARGVSPGELALPPGTDRTWDPSLAQPDQPLFRGGYDPVKTPGELPPPGWDPVSANAPFGGGLPPTRIYDFSTNHLATMSSGYDAEAAAQLAAARAARAQYNIGVQQRAAAASAAQQQMEIRNATPRAVTPVTPTPTPTTPVVQPTHYTPTYQQSSAAQQAMEQRNATPRPPATPTIPISPVTGSNYGPRGQ